MRHICRFAAVIPLLAGIPAAAQNVSSGGGIASNGFHPTVQNDAPASPKRQAAPPGIPGAQSRDTAAQRRPELDVPPTEALFDAINRGDMALARDSLNRGADFNGRNVLGMTPLELSVDLSRNDITFLLLSLRSQATVSGPPQAASPVARANAPARRPGFVVQSSGNRATRSNSGRSQPETANAAAAATLAMSYASVPARPVPQMGFLGFGATATP